MTPQRTSPLQPTGSARWLPALVGVLATALYCALSWSQWINWEVPSWDNAIFTQLLSSYASGRGPEVDLKGHGFNLLGDHFHPLLIVLAPVYKLFPSALGRTGGSVENRGSGVVVLDRAQWRSDLRGLRRDPVLLWGAVLAVWGMGVSALAVGVVLPALNPAGEFAYADKLDPAGFLRDPASAVILLVVPVRKLVTWLLVLLSGAVVAVRSPVLLVALPTLLWRMLSPNDGYWGPGWHYSAVLMPVVFVALVDAVARLRGDADRARRRTGGTAPTSPSARFEAPVLTVLAAGAPWAALVIALVVGTVQPLAQLVTPAAWQPDPRGDVKAAAVARVPEGASVATDLSLMNALVSRTRVHWIGNGEDPAPEYVVVDRSGGTWGTTPPQDVSGYAQDVYGHRYSVVSDEANIVVARESS